MKKRDSFLLLFNDFVSTKREYHVRTFWSDGQNLKKVIDKIFLFYFFLKHTNAFSDLK